MLRLDFPLHFDSFDKSCCRLFPAGCFTVMDNRGYVCDLLRGRATQTERSGSVEFRITNAQPIDAGHYRCYVKGSRYVFKDFVVGISGMTMPQFMNRAYCELFLLRLVYYKPLHYLAHYDVKLLQVC